MLTIYGTPITKKNHSQIITNPKTGRKMLIPSKQYVAYEKETIRQIGKVNGTINYPVNMQCVYFMPTRRKVDLCNLLGATCDILVKAGVIEDDNCKIITAHDGSRVDYDKENPRVEVTFTRTEVDNAE